MVSTLSFLTFIQISSVSTRQTFTVCFALNTLVLWSRNGIDTNTLEHYLIEINTSCKASTDYMLRN